VTGIRITGWGIALPDKIVTNDDMAASLDTSDAWITERTGIRERRIGGTTSGLAQVVELATQLRGRAGARQVNGARLGLAVNTGGIIEGDAGFVGVHAIRAGSS